MVGSGVAAGQSLPEPGTKRATFAPSFISDINVDEALERVRQQLKEDQTVPPSLRAAIDVLMLLVKLMADRLATSSRNSSKPPSQDPNRQRRARATGHGSLSSA